MQVMPLAFPMVFLAVVLGAYRRLRLRALRWLAATQIFAVVSLLTLLDVLPRILPRPVRGMAYADQVVFAKRMLAMQQVTMHVGRAIALALMVTFLIVLMHEVEKLQAAKKAKAEA